MAKQSSSEIAYSKLKAQILQNELAAGYQATEEEIARQLGMSRTPTHEALVRLQPAKSYYPEVLHLAIKRLGAL